MSTTALSMRIARLLSCRLDASVVLCAVFPATQIHPLGFAFEDVPAVFGSLKVKAAEGLYQRRDPADGLLDILFAINQITESYF